MGSKDEQPEKIDDGIPNILLDAFALTQGDRNSAYGPFHEDYARVARTFRALTDNDGEPMMMDSAAGCLWMVLIKLGRTVYKMQTGMAYENPASVQDDLTDAAGYLRGMFECFHQPETILILDEEYEEYEDEDYEDEDE